VGPDDQICETRHRSKFVAGFGHDTERVEIRKVHGSSV
jgi:hypothetical protein